LLLFTAILLAQAGTYCLSWSHLEVFQFSASANGRIFSSIHAPEIGGHLEIREWSRDLARGATIGGAASGRFTCSPDGDQLALSRYRRIEIVSTDTGRITTAVPHVELNGWQVVLVSDGQYAASLGSYDWQQKATPLFVFRVADGVQVLARTIPGEVQLKAADNRLAYRIDAGELVVLEFVEGEVRDVYRRTGVHCFAIGHNGSTLVVDQQGRMVVIGQNGREWIVPTPPCPHPLFDVELVGEQIVTVDRTGCVDRVGVQTGRRKRVTVLGRPAEDVPFAVGSDFIVSAETPGRITVTDLRTGSSLQGDLQTMQRFQMVWVLMAFSVVFMLWSWCLLWDGWRSGCEKMGLAPSRNGENPGKSAVAKVPVPIFSQPRRGHRWRTWIDIALIIALMHVIWIRNPSVYADHYYTRSFGFGMFLVVVWGTLGSILAFGAVMNRRYGYAPWAAIVVAAVVVPLVPAVGFGLLLRWLGWRVGHADSFGSHVNREPACSPQRLSAWGGQFSIRQLMFATMACAAALAVARHLRLGNAEFLWGGVYFAVLLLIGLLAAVTVWSSRIVLTVSLVLMGVGCAGFSIVGQHPNEFTTMILAASTMGFLCTHLRLAGYVVRRIPRSAVA
jgi:hypothetical protein